MQGYVLDYGRQVGRLRRRRHRRRRHEYAPELRYYDQLTPVKTKNPLTIITRPYRVLNFTSHQGLVFF